MATVKQINDLIVKLMAIKGFAKDIHYTAQQYGDHLLADRVQEDLDEKCDELKENVLLGNNAKVLKSSEYYEKASKEVPELKDNIEDNIEELFWLVSRTLKFCDGLKLDRADSSLVDGICEKLKNAKGLLFLRLDKGKSNGKTN